MKFKNKRKLLMALIAVLIIALIVTLGSFVRSVFTESKDAAVSILISAIESVGVLVSLVIAVRQLSDSKEIARASFITELNATFTGNSENLGLYTALQRCLDHECPHQDECTAGGKCLLDIPKVVVSNYLTFFETIYLLEKNGVIGFDLLDDLFAYRFFLAVHSRFVQQAKLAPQPENFKNIFCLEYEWMLYRERKAGKQDAPNSVYKQRPLKDLLTTEKQKQQYQKWIEECRTFQ